MKLDNKGVIEGLKEYSKDWAMYEEMKERLFGAQLMEPLTLDKDYNIIYENPITRYFEEEVERAMDYFSTLHEAIEKVDKPNQLAIIGVYIYGTGKKEIAKKINVEVSEMDEILRKGIEALKNELLRGKRELKNNKKEKENEDE